ncbi:MAG: aromatic ring-hydroxylating dioxygenase subunit alpha [Rhodospirillaceae bacterium]|jgi:carnitine monooxygenase subunit|nr:aromatic ring-hydroxylating dioxygenase subunit alpha [Rhodospirillaceae bacterium]MBT7649274.1 aromatic ring-hydroxylating dioxygenase subunit alpha [Rhodospirillaceae bacterium]
MAQGNVLKVDFGRPLSDDPELSYTLPSAYYTDPEIFELEKEKIFYRSWIYVGHVSQIAKAGDYLTADVMGQPVFVIRDRKDALRGFHNVCQHRAHELLQGSGSVKAAITCPYHAWAYGLDGALRTARNCEAIKGFDKSDFSLQSVRVETLAGMVFVNLDEDAVALAEQAPNLAADIQARIPYWDDLKLTEVYDFGDAPIKAGWKVVVDNYAECYHCEPAHPQFSDIISMPTYEHTIDGITALQLGKDIRRDNSAYPLDDDAGMVNSMFWYLWPTTTINILPGNGDLMITQIVPDGVGQTRFVNNRFSPTGEADEEVRRNYIQNILGTEDLLLCESVQRGLHSRGYDQGRFVVDESRSGIGEHVVHHFHKMVKDALDA